MALLTPDLPPRRTRGRLASLLVGTVLLLLGQLLSATPAEAGQVSFTISIQGAGEVAVVEGTLEDGYSSSWSCSTGNQDERVTVDCVTRLRNEEPFEAWVWLRATPSSTPAGNWVFQEWKGCDETRVRDGFTECAVHSGAFNAVERNPTAVFADVVDPTVGSVTPQPSGITEKTYAFYFTTSDGLAECRVGTNAFTTCTSPQQITFPTEGTRTFDVRALDPSGQTSAVTSRTVTVVDTAISSGPSGMVSSRTATFTFTSQAGVTFRCRLDSQEPQPCNSGSVTYSHLNDGPHTFRVYAENGESWDPIPAVRNWTVDATPPDTTIGTVQLAGGGALFSFGGSGGAVGFDCKLDGPAGVGTWSPCTPPKIYSGLGDGAYTFAVRAKDVVGNLDPSPDTRSWVVDTTAPDTTVDAVQLAGADASFGFIASGGAVGFECKLDGPPGAGAWSPCSSPTSYTGLADGSYTFAVRARDAAGNIEASPDTRSWVVDTTAPDTAIGIAALDGADASFDLGGSDDTVGFECKLDGPAGAGAWSPCSSPKSYAGLADGSYTFAVRAVDAGGNLDPTPDTRSWVVDTTAPDTTVRSGPRHDGFLLSPNAVVKFGATESGSTFSCTLDAAPALCPGGELTLSGLSRTTHVVTGVATDAKGNTDSTRAERRWTVPLDDADLTHRRGWSQKLGASAYLGTFSQSRTKGATVSKSVTGASKLGIVVSKAPGYGKVQVFAGTQLVKTFSTAATTRRNKQVVTVPLATPFTGEVRLVVASAEKVVRIDGLGVATGG